MNSRPHAWRTLAITGAVLVAGRGAYAQEHAPGVPNASAAHASSCHALPRSLSPADWRAPVLAPGVPSPAARQEMSPRPLRVIAQIPLPGRAARFDYQSIDPRARRLYVSHMDDDHLVVVDLDSSAVIADVGDIARPTGVLAVPANHSVYVSATGQQAVVVVDGRTLQITARVSGIDFPDGIAYAPTEEKVFVSDESGGSDVVIDTRTNRKRATIRLGGEAGNTHYDSVSHCVLVAVQTRNQLVAIDPASERVVQRYDLAGSDHPHGFAIDEPGRLAFVTSEASGILQVIDLRTIRVVATYRVGDEPDVLAWDPTLRRLYVASESGVVSVFTEEGSSLRALGQLRLPHAHTVAVDPATHRVYLPLQNVSGRPVLLILAPSP